MRRLASAAGEQTYKRLRRQPTASSPEGPCSCMVYTWALKEFLYPYVGVYVCTIMILGPLGFRHVLPVQDLVVEFYRTPAFARPHKSLAA